MRIPLFVASLLFVSASPPHLLAQGPPEPAKVVVDAVRMEQVERQRRVTGELRAAKRSLLATEREGLVGAFDLNEGDRVESGETVAVLTDPIASILVDEAESAAAAAESSVEVELSELERARLDLERLLELEKRGSASKSEMDRVRTDVASAEARVARARSELESARAALARARERVEQLTVRAPFAGYVVVKHTEVGQWLAIGDAVVEILQLDTIDAWVDVPERLAGRLTENGAEVLLRVDAADLDIRARVTRVVPQIDPLSRLFPVRVRIDNADAVLKPGMSVIGYIGTGESEPALTVHKDAILRDDAGEYVYFDAEGAAMPVRLTTLFAIGDRVAVRSDSVFPGMSVIVEGNERIMFPGQPIAPIGTLTEAEPRERDAPGAPQPSGAGG